MRPEFFDPQLAPAVVLRESEKLQANSEPVGNILCNSTATSPWRPCVFRTRARVMNSPAIPDSAYSNNLQRKTLVQSNSGCADQGPQGARHPALVSNHLAHIVRGDLEFKHVAFESGSPRLARVRRPATSRSARPKLARLRFARSYAVPNRVGLEIRYWHARQNQAARNGAGAGLATILPTRSDILAPLDTQ